MKVTQKARQDWAAMNLGQIPALAESDEAEENLLMRLDMRRWSQLVLGTNKPTVRQQQRLQPLLREWEALLNEEAEEVEET